MKPLLSILTIICFVFQLNAQEKYLLVLGKDTINIETDKQYIYVSSDGREMPIQLIKQQIQYYNSNMINFSFPNNYSVSQTDLGNGVTQTALLTADGNGFFVQEYTSLDPSDLVTIMMDELTKERISYGAQYTEETFQRFVQGGKLLIGRKRTLNFKGDTEVYTVATYGGNNNGILVVTLTNNIGNPQETNRIIDMFFDTLAIK